MSDDANIDRAQEREEQLRKEAERRRVGPYDMPGPNDCQQCGDINDRADMGYAVCTDCVEELRRDDAG